MPLSHFVPAYPSPSPCPQVHSLRLHLYSCPAPRFIRRQSDLGSGFVFHDLQCPDPATAGARPCLREGVLEENCAHEPLCQNPTQGLCFLLWFHMAYWIPSFQEPIFVFCFCLFFNLILFLFYKFILFIYFWLHWVFVAAHGLSLVVASGGYSSLRCARLSFQWLPLLQSMGSRHVGFSSCGPRAQ